MEAEKFLSWCGEKRVDPLDFILVRHDAIRWCRRLPIRELSLVKDDFIERFEWRIRQVAADRRDRVDSARVEEDTDRILGMTILGETSKASLSSTPEVCMGTSLEASPITGGWHPESAWCNVCRLEDKCRKSLGYLANRRADARR